MNTPVLVVDGDASIRATVAGVAAEWGNLVLEARSVGGALALLERDPRLVIVAARLPDGDALAVAQAAARRRPAPVVVAMGGEATAEESFRLAQAGVLGFVPKPLALDPLRQAVARALEEPPNLIPGVLASVGRIAMRGLLDELREAMIDQALALALGSRSGAARRLAVSRQAVQQIVREREGRPRPPRRRTGRPPRESESRLGPPTPPAGRRAAAGAVSEPTPGPRSA